MLEKQLNSNWHFILILNFKAIAFLLRNWINCKISFSKFQYNLLDFLLFKQCTLILLIHYFIYLSPGKCFQIFSIFELFISVYLVEAMNAFLFSSWENLILIYDHSFYFYWLLIWILDFFLHFESLQYCSFSW